VSRCRQTKRGIRFPIDMGAVGASRPASSPRRAPRPPRAAGPLDELLPFRTFALADLGEPCESCGYLPGCPCECCRYLIGRAWLERGAGDVQGAAASLAAAMALVPPEAVQGILFMIEAGELPEPGPGAEAMDAWLEQCRQAGAGDLRMTLGYVPAAPLAPQPEERPETEAEFLMRLARTVHGDNAPTPEPGAPISLAAELRAMGWM
jgi:hypothetical protein